MSKIGLLLIATGKYKQFILPLLHTVKKHFLKGHTVEVFLYADEVDFPVDWLIQHTQIGILTHFKKIPPYSFPQATLYRYKIFNEAKEYILDEECHGKIDYLFYCDVDMRFEGEVGDEILGSDLVAVRHPGFFKGGWGSPNVNPRSTAFVPSYARKNYYAGGFQGGRAEAYLKTCEILNENIQMDESNNIMAEWHDESHWNARLTHVEFKELSPSYCMVEDVERRKAWGIDNLEPKIIALNKNHSELRA